MYKKAVCSAMLALLVVSAFNLVFFTTVTLAVENLPTVWIKVHRIQAVDPIESILEDGADWRFKITVSDGETAVTKEFKCSPNNDDIVVDHVDSFSDLKHKDIYITIALFEDDLFGYETADISSGVGRTAFYCIYDLKTNKLTGDETIFESGYYKTSGDYDGSITTDENDANLWFLIWDNYEPPVANAGPDVECYTGDKVNFDGSRSTASSGSSIVKYEWDFENDGIIDAEGARTSYIYQQKGVYVCRLIVTDSIGERDDDTCLVYVRNRAPKAEFVYNPTDPTILTAVSFVDQSSDSDGYIASWLWNFGDGTNSTLQNPTHKFSQKGKYIVTLTVTDNDGEQSSIIHTITVRNLPPSASFTYTPTNPYTNTEIQFTDTSTDPENIPLTSWHWDFGDGYTSDLRNPTHKFATKGNYNVTLTVWDDENATDTFSMIISVTEPPPSQVTVPIPLWIVAVVIVVIIAAISLSTIYMLRRRKTRVT
jgi:PKD repeat protein